jgi:hypothetical protein
LAISLFGFKIGTTEDAMAKAEQIPSFVPPTRDDGAVEIAPGGAYGTFVDLEGTAKSEAELTTRYREMSGQPEVDAAIDDIVNEAIVTDFRAAAVELDLDECDDLPESIKKRIHEEFDEVMIQLDFRNMCYEIFKRWYIDGRLFYHIMIDKTRPREGIQELRYIDPRRIRKVREPVKKSAAGLLNQKNPQVPAYEEYYLYNPGGLAGAGYTQGIKIAPDSICYINSGLLDNRNRMTLSYLHKAIKPLNQLRMLEDAVVIYRLSRAPERRIFYIDVGNLPKVKAEQYMRDMMVRHKNRLVYDAQTGEVRDDRKFMTMLEDFWLPRREGARGTEITTLPGGQNLGQMDDVYYFQKKLYKALNVPESRLQAETGFNMGRANEITRDEVKFAKFITRLRHRFSAIFNNLLEIQLALKGVMSREEWTKLKPQVQYNFLSDNSFQELKNQDLMTSRMVLLATVDPFLGKYYSKNWVQKNVLRLTEEEIDELEAEIKKEGPEVAVPGSPMDMQTIQQQASAAQQQQAAAAQQQQQFPSGGPEDDDGGEPQPLKVQEQTEANPKELTEEEKKLITSMTRFMDSMAEDTKE